MCAPQPLGQQPCGFVRRPSVERHERASGPGDPHDVSPPAVGRNRPDLDEIEASCDRFFEAMNDVGHKRRCGIFLRLRAIILAGDAPRFKLSTHEGVQC
jgi:hypothetical protein